MAQKILVEFPVNIVRDIPERLIDGGWDLLPLLQEASLNITAAFWQYLGPDEEWMLILTTPLVQTEGQGKIINRVARVMVDDMTNQHHTPLRLSYILVQSPVSTLVQNARRKYGKVPSDKRIVRRTSLSDDEAYVYLLQ